MRPIVVRHKTPLLLALLLVCMPPPVLADAQEEARALVNAKARALFMKHRRAIKALDSTLRNPAFKAFVMAESPDQRSASRADIEKSILKVQRYFALEEMCLIDRAGHEHVRMVDGKLDEQLSDSERENPFFAPAFALPEGDVLVSDVYVSQDSGRWAMAYVTPIAVHGGNVGLLHYEQEVASVAVDLVRGIDARQALLGFDETGRVLFDSRAGDALPPPAGAALPAEIDGVRLAEYVSAAETDTPLDVAVKRVRGWTLVALQGLAG